MKKLLLTFTILFSLISLAGCFGFDTISSIEVLNAKTEYQIGENFDLSQLELKIKQGTNEFIKLGSDSGVTVTGFDNSKLGTRYLTIKYSGVSVTLSYTIKATPVTVSGDEELWLKDRTMPKSFDIDEEGIITMEVATSASSDEYYRWQGRSIQISTLMPEAKSYWYAESTYYFTETILNYEKSQGSLWFHVVDDTGKSLDYSILCFGNKGDSTEKKWIVWNSNEDVKDWYPINYDAPQVGQYKIAVEFDNGMLRFYINNDLVNSYLLNSKTSKIASVHCMARNFGEGYDYTIKMSLPIISW